MISKASFLKTKIASDNPFFYRPRILTDQKGLVMLPLLYYPALLFVSILPLANTFSLLLPVNYMALCVCVPSQHIPRTQWPNSTFLGMFTYFQNNWVNWLNTQLVTKIYDREMENIHVPAICFRVLLHWSI